MDKINKIWSVSSICEGIWSIEEQQGLLHYQLHGVFIWQHIRMQVYYALAAELQVFDRSKPAAKKNWKQVLGDICNIKYSRFFIRNTGTTVAFIPSNRWERTKNGNSEQFIELILEEILGNNDSVAILSKEIPSTPRENVCWLCSADMYSVAELKSRLFNAKISTEDHEWISRLSQSLFSTFGTDVNITHRILKALIQYKSLFSSIDKRALSITAHNVQLL